MTQNDKKEYIIGQRERPRDSETEEVVLATMMRYNDIYEANSDLMDASLFFDERRQAIFRTIVGTINEGKITDINTLYSYSKSHKVGVILDKVEFVSIFQKSSPATFKQDVLRLRDLSKRRQTYYQLLDAADKIFNPLEETEQTIDDAIKILTEIQDDKDESNISTFGDAINELRGIVEDNRSGKHRYLKTGFFVFDHYYLLRPDTLTIIAAFTSVGKSALAMNIALNIARQGIGVGYYSLEMGKAELASRGISGLAGVSSSDIMNTKLEGQAYDDFKAAAARESNLPIYIDERATISFDKTIRSITTLVKQGKIKIAMIDYLQIYNQKGDNVEGILAYMARECKNASKRLGIPFVVLSQLNRSADHPSRKMLRGSGQIEESADNIVLIDRPESEPNSTLTYEGSLKDKPTHNTAAFILAKGRGVGTCMRLVGFEPRFTQFYDLDDNGNPIQNITPQPEESVLPF